MSNRRSILDRQGLYCPAPIISGQASYGGVPKSIYFIVPMVFLGTFVVSMLVGAAALIATGEFYVRLIIFTPLIVTFMAAGWLVGVSKRRRDFINVLKESYEFKDD